MAHNGYLIDDCQLADDIRLGCEDYAVGGTSTTMYFMNQDSVSGFTRNADNSIKDIVFKPGYIKALKVQFAAKTGNAAQPLQGDQTSSKNFAQTIGFTLKGANQEIYNSIMQLGRSNGFYVIVIPNVQNDPSGLINKEKRMFMFGTTTPLVMATSETTFGAAETDGVQSVVTFTGAQTELSPEIVPDPTVYTSTLPNAEFLAAISENP